MLYALQLHSPHPQPHISLSYPISSPSYSHPCIPHSAGNAARTRTVQHEYLRALSALYIYASGLDFFRSRHIYMYIYGGGERNNMPIPMGDARHYTSALRGRVTRGCVLYVYYISSVAVLALSPSLLRLSCWSATVYKKAAARERERERERERDT